MIYFVCINISLAIKRREISIMKGHDADTWSPGRDEVIDLLQNEVTFREKTETVRVEDGVGRILAEDLLSDIMLPNAANCRWDGVVVHFDYFVNGMPDTSEWKCGREYDFGNTGIAVKEGFDTQIVIEDVEFDEDGSIILKRVPKMRGEFTVPVGSTMRKGEVLAKKYEKLTSNHLAVIAMGGHRMIKVLKKPVVAIIPSGNELVPVNMKLPGGKNWETNSIMLAAKVREWGGEPLVYNIIPDDYQTLLGTLKDAASRSDMVLFNAGSSKGTDDHAYEVLRDAGKLYFHSVAYGPGHHTAFSIVDGVPVLGLVGVPGGADFNADWYGGILISMYYHQPLKKPVHVTVTVKNDQIPHIGIAARNDSDDKKVRTHSGVDMYVRLYIWQEDGEFYGKFTEKEDDYRTGFVDANAYACLPAGTPPVKTGDRLDVFLRYSYEDILAEII